ncbi:CoA transferase [Halomonas sp. McH1-25]|uniref:CaiB/BaiF CoA transferase family protein n=1 Tax=unclassified Halomonas TaxID=2609666 RepID=UPI001EF59D42|nr:MULTISPECIES: CoA transferase [unclassified Halomonas]MCG7601522.1 CoA transferase [Halomonas sp. McH1-25]MCP1343927.1 CoA transferase [Halomonas sp. FL8]MCP1361538.1 CoA transferase [Halomonas sp. BBD45]MCP1363987.1 CoA transferase [Halomonas sp. BBD48]
MSALLSGYRVLDLTNVLAGPFCCHQLAHLGAEVIKVERPQGGDLARQLGADPELNRDLMGVSFLAQNAGKRSVTLDLKQPDDRRRFLELVREADVLVENFRPGVMQRLELGYEALCEVNPELIYCAISGFGQDGPLANYPAYDQIIQGMAGVMSITGAPDNAPYRVGYPLADTVGGLTAAMSINAALAERPRRAHFIDISMLESVLATMGWAVSNLLIAGKEPRPLGNDNVTASPSGTFRTGDGLINIAANKQEQFEAVCHILGHPEWCHDPRFAERQARLDHRTELTHCIEAALGNATTEHWWRTLVEAGVPAGPVYSVAEALAHPQVRDRGLIERFDESEVGRPLEVVSGGYRIDGQAPRVATPPPRLGADNQELLPAHAANDE